MSTSLPANIQALAISLVREELWSERAKWYFKADACAEWPFVYDPLTAENGADFIAMTERNRQREADDIAKNGKSSGLYQTTAIHHGNVVGTPMFIAYGQTEDFHIAVCLPANVAWPDKTKEMDKTTAELRKHIASLSVVVKISTKAREGFHKLPISEFPKWCQTKETVKEIWGVRGNLDPAEAPIFLDLLDATFSAGDDSGIPPEESRAWFDAACTTVGEVFQDVIVRQLARDIGYLGDCIVTEERRVHAETTIGVLGDIPTPAPGNDTRN